jgi:hypothetical protein
MKADYDSEDTEKAFREIISTSSLWRPSNTN